MNDRRDVPHRRDRWSTRLAIASASAAIALATLVPMPSAGTTPGPWCIACGDFGGQDFAANIVLFTPLGVALALHGMGPWRGAGLSLLASFLVELLQWRLIPGRDASVGDLLANTLGGALGCAITSAFLHLRRRSPALAFRSLALATAAAWIAGACAASWALRPSPMGGIVWVQLSLPRRGFEPFEGQVHFALFGRSLDNGTAVLAESFPQLDSGRVSIQLDLMRDANSQLPGRALILRLANPFKVAVQVTQEGRDLVFQGHHNASRVGLRSPSFRLDGVMGPGVARVTARMETGGPHVVLNAESEGRAVGRSVPITLGSAWELGSPALPLPRWVRMALGPLSLALAAVAIGGAAAAAWPLAQAVTWVAIVHGLGLVFIPLALGIASARAPEGAAVVAGGLVGLWLGRRGSGDR